MRRFSVAIVNFNGGAYVQAALDSLARQTFRDFEVILVDNASHDGSVDGLDTSGLPAFTLMREDTNHGFARANNMAADAATGTWFVLLNPDAQARDDWLERLDAAIERHGDVAMFASAQYDLEDPDRLDGAGDNYLIFGIPWRGGFGRPARELPAEGECFSPCGAGAAYCRETYLAHGGFDERFFCFCEDVDLAFRMRLAGERCVFLPDAVVRHAGGGLSGRASAFSVRHGARNRIWTYVKNMPLPLLVITLPGHVALTTAILLRGLMTGRFAPTARGIADGLAGLGPIMKARRQVQRSGSANLSGLVGAMSINPLPMLRRKVVVRPMEPVQPAPLPAARA